MAADQVTEDLLRGALIDKLNYQVRAEGAITLPVVPGLVDEYTDRLGQIFAGIGRRFGDDELADLRSKLTLLLSDAFQLSARSTITVSYSSTMYGPVVYEIRCDCTTLEAKYDEWIATREPPLFGVEPDARVLALAGESDPADCRVLDIGAGTGRNALPLARRGHSIDVVELNAQFAEMIRQSAARESLDVRVIQRDVLQTDDDLRGDYSLILLSEVVPEFRTTEDLRFLFELAARRLVPGGRLLFNIFLAWDAYTPDEATRQYARYMSSNFFTGAELASAAAGLPLDLEADDLVFDYEKANLPQGAWPPTKWYAPWITGQNVFGLPPESCPIDMRWLVYRRNH